MWQQEHAWSRESEYRGFLNRAVGIVGWSVYFQNAGEKAVWLRDGWFLFLSSFVERRTHRSSFFSSFARSLSLSLKILKHFLSLKLLSEKTVIAVWFLFCLVGISVRFDR